VKIIDSFCYNGETLALFRMAYLWSVVDEFLVIEAKETHSGQVKPALFLDQNENLLRPFSSKLKRLVIDRFPTPTDIQIECLKPSSKGDPVAWHREKYQRNYAIDYLRGPESQPPWILFVCDADEIPRRKMVSTMAGHYDSLGEGCKLEMQTFYYSSQWIKPQKWYHAFVINDLGVRQRNLDDLRIGPNIRTTVLNAGWHLSYFMTKEEIHRKIQSFAHKEYNYDS
jgi:hypothetical protein